MYQIENGIESMHIKNGDLFINECLVLKDIDDEKRNLKIKKIKIC